MLFSVTLQTFQKIVQEAVRELFDTAFSNQSHPQDLLLVIENGFFWKQKMEDLKKMKLSPYMIGPSIEGYSAQTQYRFYNFYRHNIETNRDEFIDKAKAGIDKININVRNYNSHRINDLFEILGSGTDCKKALSIK